MSAPLSRRLPARLLPLPQPQAPDAWRRAAAFGLVWFGVWLGHQWLLGGLGQWLQRPGREAPAPTPSRSWVLSPTRRTTPAPTPSPEPTFTKRAEAAPSLPRPAQRAAPPPPTATATSPPATPPEAVTPPTRPALPEAADAAPDAEPARAGAGDEAGALSAPPLYPTRLPPSAELRFSVQRGAQQGVGHWRWQVEGRGYTSELQAELDGHPWLSQHSRGLLDAHGLAPERLLEQGKGRSARAVNFQRDKAVLSFSGSRRSWPLWPGTQDRLSWLPQLLAIVAARPSWQPGDTLSLATASPRGELALWRWTLLDLRGPDGIDPPLLHWVREPERPYDHRIDLWLLPKPPHWPVGWQWQLQAGGDRVRWWREGPDPGP